jgi:hypothetical protein
VFVLVKHHLISVCMVKIILLYISSGHVDTLLTVASLTSESDFTKHFTYPVNFKEFTLSLTTPQLLLSQ